jgi:uncharacterized protein
MILYLGTSSLVKLYVDEPYSETIRDWVMAAEIVATCRIAFTEAMAAFDIRFKKGDLSKDDYDLIVKKLSEDWHHFARIDFDDYEAGNLVKQYGITRFAALHLSAAKLLTLESDMYKAGLETKEKRKSNITLFFSSADKKLAEAAMSEGLKVLPLN